MDVRNCKRCGKIFNYYGSYICNDCRQQDEADFTKIRQYIINHPKSSALEISEATGIDPRIITRFMREGRLEFDEFDTSDSGLTCEKCGKDIKSGRYCENCLAQLHNGLQDAVRKFDDKNVSAAARARETLHTYDSLLKKYK